MVFNWSYFLHTKNCAGDDCESTDSAVCQNEDFVLIKCKVILDGLEIFKLSPTYSRNYHCIKHCVDRLGLTIRC